MTTDETAAIANAARTFFVTGSDTGIGKTRVAAAIARLLARPNMRIQFVKPVETGRTPNEPGDADSSRRASRLPTASAITLLRYPLPIAPCAAAAAEGSVFSLDLLLEQWQKLPPADLRIVEGAGGLAVPLDSGGRDWTDFARAITTDRIVLVVPDRLGAINQARLTAAYAKRIGKPAGLWLNEVEAQSDEVRRSNRDALEAVPLIASQRFGAELPENPERTLTFFST